MQGEIVIGTKLDNRQLEKDLAKEERELQKFKKEAEKLTQQKIEFEFAVKDMDLIFEKLDDQISRIKDEMLEIELGGTTTANPRYEEYMQLADELAGFENTRQLLLEESEKKYEEINRLMEQNAHNQEVTNQRIEEMRAKLASVKETEKIENSFKNIGNSMIGIVKKVGMWALALFGVRSAVSFISRSMSTLSQYDKGMAQDLQYISYLIASTLKPIVEWIIKAVYTLLAYIRYIAKAWFNIDIFAHASTEEFLKQRDAMGQTNKDAKELRKTLAGFDEMNILDDNVTSTSDVGGLAENLPELPNLDDINIPGWVEFFGMIGKGVRTALSNLDDLFNGFIAGASLSISKVIEIVSKIVGWFRDNIATPITTTTGNIFATIINGASNFVTLIAQILSRIVVWIMNNIIMPIQTAISMLWSGITSGFTGMWNGLKTSLSTISNWIYNYVIKPVLDKIKNGVTNMFNGIKTAIISPINWIIDALNIVISGLNKISITIPKWVPQFGGKKWGFNIKKVPKIKLAVGGIINMPGKGVPVGNAIAGERGAEGVIPLTDSQQMSLLGEAIGKYITVNLTNITELDGRTIARKVSEVNNNTNFLLNR